MTDLTASRAPVSPAPAKPVAAAAVAAVLSAMTLVVLDAGIVNVALPAVAEALEAAPARAILVVTTYQAGLVTALLPAGALGERFGHRRVFMLGVLLFALASAGCAAAGSLAWLVAARFVQGLGGAAIMALGVALLRLTVSDGRLGAAIGWNALTVALASAAAPSLGAAILGVAPWPGLFMVNLPVAAFALLAGRALPGSRSRGAAPNAVSIGLNAAGFGGLILAGELALSESALAVGLLAAGASALMLLVRQAAKEAAPLLPIDLLRSEPFRLAAAASVLCFTAQSMGLLALPFLLQHQLGQTALQAGAYITLWPLSVAAAAIVSSRLAERAPAAWLCALGAVVLAGGLGAAAWVPLQGQAARLAPCLVLCGVGFGLFQSPNNRTLFLSAPAARSGAAGGLQGAARVTGQTLGSVVTGLLFGAWASSPAPGLGVAAVVALIAGVVSLLRALR